MGEAVLGEEEVEVCVNTVCVYMHHILWGGTLDVLQPHPGNDNTVLQSVCIVQLPPPSVKGFPWCSGVCLCITHLSRANCEFFAELNQDLIAVQGTGKIRIHEHPPPRPPPGWPIVFCLGFGL